MPKHAVLGQFCTSSSRMRGGTSCSVEGMPGRSPYPSFLNFICETVSRRLSLRRMALRRLRGGVSGTLSSRTCEKMRARHRVRTILPLLRCFFPPGLRPRSSDMLPEVQAASAACGESAPSVTSLSQFNRDFQANGELLRIPGCSGSRAATAPEPSAVGQSAAGVRVNLTVSLSRPFT